MNIDYIKVKKDKSSLFGSVSINGSKSISNRLLILKAIYKDEIDIVNLSNCEDTELLKTSLISNSNVLNIHHAGTAMRFLTSYLSIQKERETILTGSKRMKERPILVLVNALKKLGAKIFYLEKEGYPPIKILGKEITGGEIDINAKISSQYITSLMLVASKFKNGLKIYMKDNITSFPYIKMTFNLLTLAGIKVLWENKVIHIFPGKKQQKKCFYIESDWSSASYYYSMSAIAKESKITLSSYNIDSLQGDKNVSSIYEKYFGVYTSFKESKITIYKKFNFSLPKFFELDLNNTPDLAQTIVVTCAIIGIKCYLKGLETLKIKETDRLIALKEELYKIGIITSITNSSIRIDDFYQQKKNDNIFLNTYQDHRMAMSFAPLGLLNTICIEDPYVVNKSYPNFWKDLKSIGFSIENYFE
ncbi:3-phosphoshikimate 1-carboxyvinyltransferase [Blattabacterium cuenoti]|uniref:3-phosphoshikimate 1-carboxyvinyltransferase n=1 Tax=Blattabacterium cuenoti TaxID=1653831 RepID=UPI00163CD85E|nr:3-phosphoshikimate 1-carboxyvinyltransferase [Blattabacterium cuenoti]